MQIVVTSTVSANPHVKHLPRPLLRPSPPYSARVHLSPSRNKTSISISMAGSTSSPPQELTITRPDDWHLHLREGDVLAAVLPHSARHFGRAIVMPNLKPSVTTTARAMEYREEILTALPPGSSFVPLMTLYLTDNTRPEEIKLAKKSGVVFAVKLYPVGATTNSQDGVTDIFWKCLPVLEEMARQEMPLLVGKVGVSCTQILLLALEYEPPRTKSFKTVESLRADALASARFKISRTKLASLISAGDVCELVTSFEKWSDSEGWGRCFCQRDGEIKVRMVFH